MNIGSQELIRELNTKLVLNTIIEYSPLSRADLSKKCKLTKATISSIVQDLLNSHLIREVGNGDSSLGRKPILLQFCQDCGYCISIDIGVDSFTVLVSDLKGENCSLKEYKRSNREVTIEEVSNIIQLTISGIPESPYGIVGICLGVYGVVYEKKVLFTPYYELENASDFCNILEETFKIPFFIENDANLCVLGESRFHPDKKNIIYLNVHSGIGSGIMIDGKLFKGTNGYAGEIGHSILFPNGRPCPCGNHGCFEQYASERAILDDYASRKKLSNVTLENFIRDYLAEDTDAKILIQEFIQYFSICINNLIYMYNPDVIILNCNLTNNIPELLDQIFSNLKSTHKYNISLLLGETQDISELLGGIYICSQNFFEHIKTHIFI